MNKKSTTGLSIFLKKLLETLNDSTIAYRQYIEAGKTFQLAQQLKLYNGKAFDLLTSNKHLLPENLQQDADALIHHYGVWTEKWEALAKELKPVPGDLFVFANTITFPRQAAHNLETTYETLKKENKQ